MHAARLHFTLATATDAHAVFDLVYRYPDPFLRTATIHDVEGWTAKGTCWIVRDLAGPTVVGACNIKVPATPDPAEFGGIFLHPDFRVRGIADALSTLALSSYYWDNDPDSPDPIPIISHVHVKNDKPLKLIDRLGFEFDKVVEVPDDEPGFEHMPRDDDGKLRGKEFQMPPTRRIHLFREMAKLLSTDQIAGYTVHVVPALRMEPAELERLAAALEAQQGEQAQR